MTEYQTITMPDGIVYVLVPAKELPTFLDKCGRFEANAATDTPEVLYIRNLRFVHDPEHSCDAFTMWNIVDSLPAGARLRLQKHRVPGKEVENPWVCSYRPTESGPFYIAQAPVPSTACAKMKEKLEEAETTLWAAAQHARKMYETVEQMYLAGGELDAAKSSYLNLLHCAKATQRVIAILSVGLGGGA